jgi:hypothetical protein
MNKINKKIKINKFHCDKIVHVSRLSITTSSPVDSKKSKCTNKKI